MKIRVQAIGNRYFFVVKTETKLSNMTTTTLTLDQLRTIEDNISLSSTMLVLSDANIRIANFKALFKWATPPINLPAEPVLSEWATLWEDVPMKALISLYDRLNLPAAGSHYLSALKAYCACETQGNLVILFQPFIMHYNESQDGSPVDEFPTSGEDVDYLVSDTSDDPYYWLTTDHSGQITLDVHPNAQDCISNYQKMMVSRKYRNRHDSNGTFIDEAGFNGDTKYAIVPFQEILLAYGDYDAIALARNVRFAHVTSTYKSRSVFLTYRWKHHFILEGGDYIVNPASANYGDKCHLCPPICSLGYATFQLS